MWTACAGQPTKNPPCGGFFIATDEPEGLLDLAFQRYTASPHFMQLLAIALKAYKQAVFNQLSCT
jgi:hypothetical protein